jgi:uncharacterized protein (DUF362 family)
MRRRFFLQLPAAAPLAAAISDSPAYRVVSPYKPAELPGMPGPYPGQVVSLYAPKSVDPETETVDGALVAEMMKRGMTSLTGDSSPAGAWARFFSRTDEVGIKVNCSGAPKICSHPAVVAEIVRNLIAVGVPPKQIQIYERFSDQLKSVRYEDVVPSGVRVEAVGSFRSQLSGYDPKVYVETDFFGEDDTRSNMVRWVTERFNKIINVPNLKDHQASGVTGCLKNIAYGNFHNVARSHQSAKTHTLTFIGTLAMVEPLRSRTVLQIMDGLKCVWHGGPFSPRKKYRFYPGRMLFATDPVAVDRLLLDFIDEERKRHGAVSVWDRSTARTPFPKGGEEDPNLNRFVREPGHIEYAAKLGLGVYDKAKIKVKEIAL